LRYYRTTGLALSQMQELVRRVRDALSEPWNKKVGRPRSCGLYRAVEVACMYIRQNCSQEFLGDLRDISQPTVSRIVTVLVPIIKTVLEEFVPAAKDAIEMVNGRVCLVDGTITPCWSYAEHDELWSRKHGTTGFNAQLVGLLDGTAVYISDPLAGKTHDARAFTETSVAEIVRNSGGGIGDKGYQGTDLVTPRKKPRGGELSKRDKECNAEISRLRAPVERLVAHFKSWRIFHTDYRRPYSTYRNAFDAARGLFFFSLTHGFE
jgi:DDE superfamily endonuclease